MHLEMKKPPTNCKWFLRSYNQQTEANNKIKNRALFKRLSLLVEIAY
jgi:hypothetical protein